jgi:hypothetical protein
LSDLGEILDVLTVTETARILGCARLTVYRWYGGARIPARRLEELGELRAAVGDPKSLRWLRAALAKPDDGRAARRVVARRG